MDLLQSTLANFDPKTNGIGSLKEALGPHIMLRDPNLLNLIIGDWRVAWLVGHLETFYSNAIVRESRVGPIRFYISHYYYLKVLGSGYKAVVQRKGVDFAKKALVRFLELNRPELHYTKSESLSSPNGREVFLTDRLTNYDIAATHSLKSKNDLKQNEIFNTIKSLSPMRWSAEIHRYMSSQLKRTVIQFLLVRRRLGFHRIIGRDILGIIFTHLLQDELIQERYLLLKINSQMYSSYKGIYEKFDVFYAGDYYQTIDNREFYYLHMYLHVSVYVDNMITLAQKSKSRSFFKAYMNDFRQAFAKDIGTKYKPYQHYLVQWVFVRLVECNIQPSICVKYRITERIDTQHAVKEAICSSESTANVESAEPSRKKQRMVLEKYEHPYKIKQAAALIRQSLVEQFGG